VPESHPPPADALEPERASAAVYSNSFRTLTRSLGATGLRTHAVRYDSLAHGEGARCAEEFLVNSRLRRRDVEFEASVASYYSDSTGTMLSLLGRESHSGTVVALPAPEPMRMATGEAIRRRRSLREYTGDSMSLKHLATLLAAACGVTGSGGAIALRSTASGGALYPVELYIAALRVDGLDRAIYGYSARRHELFRVGADLDRLLESIVAPDDVITLGEANLICLLAGRPWRSMRKYGPRGMRHVFLEAGAIAAHLHLACVALGFGSVDCSGVYDDEAHEALGIDGVYEALLHTVIVGVPG
jgi:SagB-type dehydrogenase family enzyme